MKYCARILLMAIASIFATTGYAKTLFNDNFSIESENYWTISKSTASSYALDTELTLIAQGNNAPAIRLISPLSSDFAFLTKPVNFQVTGLNITGSVESWNKTFRLAITSESKGSWGSDDVIELLV